MGNTTMTAGEIPTTPLAESVTVIHRDSGTTHAWAKHSVWYHATPSETSSSDAVRDLISYVSRLGVNVLTLPAHITPYPISDSIHRAQKRGLRILPNIADSHVAPEVIDQWLAEGAWGIELGLHHLKEHITTVNDLTLGQIQAKVSLAHPDSVLSLGLWDDDAEKFDELSNQVHDAYVHIVRSRPLALPLTIDNIAPQLVDLYRLFESTGTLPAWDLSAPAIHTASSYLSPAGIVLLTLALPGLIHIDQQSITIPPAPRHILRLRNAYYLANSSLAIDRRQLQNGILRMFVDTIEVRMNFGSHNEPLPTDGSVLAMSHQKPSQSPNDDLYLPSGEVAWIKLR
ncbi:hypothetical protein [Arcanobacterium buesumense]|uniref:Uncharacterized protein n=1 Tax=Arcanobacterium buesumense TaxID=2722751 RepID=A0A6H2EL18_9ACTO|nr:hypothetical protein [Arcanobacterium buesumense]QJC21631.1 hypothetical protein HC352_03320 [Arcanobacterium buesumense]